MPVENHAIANRFCNSVQNGRARTGIGPSFRIACQFASPAEAYLEQCTFCPRAPARFVPRAMDERLERYPTANIERTDSLWCVEFVTGHGKEIDTELRSHRSGSCRRIAPHRCGRGCHAPERFGGFRDRLNGADLVVGVHDADEHGARRIPLRTASASIRPFPITGRG